MQSESSRTYRTRLQIIRDILLAARNGNNKTGIMRVANLNPAYHGRYILSLEESGYLKKYDSKYYTTPDGEKVLADIERIILLSKEFENALANLKWVGKVPAQPSQLKIFAFNKVAR